MTGLEFPSKGKKINTVRQACCTLRPDAAQQCRLCHALDGDSQGNGTKIRYILILCARWLRIIGRSFADNIRLSAVEHSVHRRVHSGLERFVDLFSIPLFVRLVLYPFVVAHGDATGIGENVRQDVNTPLFQHIVRCRRGRIISAFNDQPGLDVAGMNLVAQRGRYQDVAIEFQ